jgi:hypothetical protein
MQELKLIGDIFSHTSNGIEHFYTTDVDGNIKSFFANVAAEQFTLDDLKKHINSKNSTKTETVNYSCGSSDTTSNPSKSATKPDIVRVTRHFRRFDFYTESVASNGGIAAVCHLDYKNNLITVYPSLCSVEDNYDKEIGLALAEVREKHDIGFMVKFDKDISIRENLYHAIYQQYCVGHKQNQVIYLNDISKQTIEIKLVKLFMGEDDFSGVFDGL